MVNKYRTFFSECRQFRINLCLCINIKKTFMKKIFIFLSVVTGIFAHAQEPPKPYGVLPAKRQLNWHETGMYCIIHFGVDTYTDKEWGFGDEDTALVNPSHFDAMQIVGAAKAGGFMGVV